MEDNWNEWQNHVLKSLERMECKQDAHDDRFVALEKKFIHIETKLNTRAGFIGGMIGFVLAIGTLIVGWLGLK